MQQSTEKISVKRKKQAKNIVLPLKKQSCNSVKIVAKNNGLNASESLLPVQKSQALPFLEHFDQLPDDVMIDAPEHGIFEPMFKNFSGVYRYKPHAQYVGTDRYIFSSARCESFLKKNSDHCLQIWIKQQKTLVSVALAIDKYQNVVETHRLEEPLADEGPTNEQPTVFW